MSEQKAEFDQSLRERTALGWWAFRRWLRRCPECRVRGFSPESPRWRDDKVAQMLGIAQYGCPRCGHGSIEERDRVSTSPEQQAPR